MMYDMDTATPEYRSNVLGAFAWAHLDLIAHHGRDLKLKVDDEPDASLYRRTFTMGGRPLRVTVALPYGRPDPRGPNSGESTHMVFDAGGRMVRQRPPAQVGAVVPLGLSARELMYHAAATRWRLDRELERGYGLLQTSVPPPDHIAAERTLLPEHAETVEWHDYVARREEGYEEVVDGELFDDSFPKQDLSRLRDLVANPYERIDMRGEPIITRDRDRPLAAESTVRVPALPRAGSGCPACGACEPGECGSPNDPGCIERAAWDEDEPLLNAPSPAQRAFDDFYRRRLDE